MISYFLLRSPSQSIERSFILFLVDYPHDNFSYVDPPPIELDDVSALSQELNKFLTENQGPNKLCLECGSNLSSKSNLITHILNHNPDLMARVNSFMQAHIKYLGPGKHLCRLCKEVKKLNNNGIRIHFIIYHLQCMNVGQVRETYVRRMETVHQGGYSSGH